MKPIEHHRERAAQFAKDLKAEAPDIKVIDRTKSLNVMRDLKAGAERATTAAHALAHELNSLIQAQKKADK